jgi:hypothetical protein
MGHIFKLTLPIQFGFNAQRVGDLITSALEGGSNYWLENYTITKQEPVMWNNLHDTHTNGVYAYCYPLNDGGALIFEGEEGKFILDLTTIQYGLKFMGENYFRHFKDFVDEDDDANTADIFLQCCLFEGVIYG